METSERIKSIIGVLGNVAELGASPNNYESAIELFNKLGLVIQKELKVFFKRIAHFLVYYRRRPGGCTYSHIGAARNPNEREQKQKHTLLL